LCSAELARRSRGDSEAAQGRASAREQGPRCTGPRCSLGVPPEARLAHRRDLDRGAHRQGPGRRRRRQRRAELAQRAESLDAGEHVAKLVGDVASRLVGVSALGCAVTGRRSSPSDSGGASG
jgi:hypothetical protein